jgi:hypothetical protein
VAGGDGLQEVVADKAAALNEHARRTWLMLYEVKEPPGTAGGSCSCSRAAYRLAWRLAPPLGPLSGPLPRTSPVETSLTQSEPLPL